MRSFSLFAKPVRLRLAIEGDGSGHELRVRLASHFQMFERALGTIDRKGPQKFEATLAPMTGWQHFGGENDGLARLPLRFSRLILVRKTDRPKGTIGIKKLEIETGFPADGGIVVLPVGERAGDKAVFHATIRNLHETTVSGELLWEVRDLQTVVLRGARALSLQPGAVPQSVTIESPLGTRPFVEGTFTWRGPAHRSAPISATVTQLPAFEGSGELDPASPMGAGLYLYRWYGNPAAHERMTAVATLARRAGVKWTREEFQWARIEPKRGEFDWKFYDDLVEVAARQGISVYGLLSYWSGWTKPYTVEGVEYYCRWAAQVVRRYRKRIKHWEVWNEPNIFFWSGPKDLYATLLRRAYKVIKREDPEAQVLGCSTSGIDTRFIKRMMELGAPFDVLTIHPYRGDLDERQFIQELRQVRQLVGGRPVWITEMGWSSHIGGISERRQAGLVARTYLSAIASGAVGNVSWYDFRNDGDDPFYNEMNFGLVRSDLTPKLGYRALATVGHLLEGASPDRELELGDGVVGFKFTGRRCVIAIWCKHEDRLLSAKVGGDHARLQLLDTAGQEIRTPRVDNVVCCALEAGLPVYLVAPDDLDVSVAPSPVQFTAAKRALHAGDRVVVKVRSRRPIKNIAWEVPLGWADPEPRGRNGFEVTVPPGAITGRQRLSAFVSVAEQTLRLPLTIWVQPSILSL